MTVAEVNGADPNQRAIRYRGAGIKALAVAATLGVAAPALCLDPCLRMKSEPSLASWCRLLTSRPVLSASLVARKWALLTRLYTGRTRSSKYAQIGVHIQTDVVAGTRTRHR